MARTESAIFVQKRLNGRVVLRVTFLLQTTYMYVYVKSTSDVLQIRRVVNGDILHVC